ncbi:MAG: amidohydrolase family protein [Acidimicrobiia bacterium]|nr:amidohydrolase family protein [Acidimicrobiia bacterium]
MGDVRPVGAQEPLVLRGGMLLDGYESEPIHHAAVVVADGRIVWVGPAADVEIPAGARVIDTSGQTMMPGLIDAHAHVDLIGHGDYDRFYEFIGGTERLLEMTEISMGQLVRAGVTTAVDLGAPLDILEVRDRVDRGELPGPRLLASGAWITRITLDGVPLSYQNVISSPAEAAAAAERLIRDGADVIKLWSGLTEADMRAVVEVAHSNSIRVHAHLYEPDVIWMAIRAGIDVFQHVGSGGNPPYDEDLIAEVAHRGIPIVQTIAHRIWIYPATLAFPERLQDPRLKRDFPADVWEEVQDSFKDFARLSYFRTTPRQIRNAKVAARQFIDANAVMGVGTDAASPANFHTQAMWREMEALIESGMTPMQVISAATKTNAELLGLGGETGTVEPGKAADLLVVDGNPLANIRALDRVRWVVARGRLIDPDHHP